VALAGDINGDGVGDMAITAYLDDKDGLSNNGAIYLLNGPVYGEVSLSEQANATLWGESDDDYAGRSISSAGDVDGDGMDDLIIGVSLADDEAGAAYLFAGAIAGDASLQDADARLAGEFASDRAGGSVSGAGDVNGDGTDDVLVGAYNADPEGASSGRAYLLYGALNGSVSLASSDVRWSGITTGDRLGYAVSGVGDVDGDGNDDVLISAYGEDSGGSGAGQAYLFYGPVNGDLSAASSDVVYSGTGADEQAGKTLARAGDINGDGLSDFLIGMPNQDDGVGGAYLVFGLGD